MTKYATAIIDAGYGDSGKGLLTDYFSFKNLPDVVIRFNGGAQAGHTVVTPTGDRHVFSHVGSGTFCGISTYLSRYFVVNPMLFKKEAERFPDKFIFFNNLLLIDEDAIVTTPYDILINQALERSRGNNRHGSCGVGFGETIDRAENKTDLSIKAIDLNFYSSLKRKLENIRDKWVPNRLEELNLILTKDESDILYSEEIISKFLIDCDFLLNHSEIVNINSIKKLGSFLFEGAQGLMLDQQLGNFPNVTRSFTGLRNVLSLSSQLEVENIQSVYTTRCYKTRHGAGPLDHELFNKPYHGIVDLTNIPNDYQGSLRFAYLDLDILKNIINEDLIRANNFNSQIKINHQLAITCLDQVGYECKVFHDGILKSFHNTNFSDAGDLIAKNINLSSKLIKSYGPSRNFIFESKK